MIVCCDSDIVLGVEDRKRNKRNRTDKKAGVR
jgi:hypothetical protein